MKAFSFEIGADMALFKKNDANDIALTSYNFLHKPVLLGIFGAILGLRGYKQFDDIDSVEYYEKLKNFKVAIVPLYRKPLRKVLVTFNNSTGLASEEEGGTMQVTEQVIVEPVKYEVVVPLLESFSDEEKELYNTLEEMVKKQYSKYPIYFGKNEFLAYFENYIPLELEKFDGQETFVASLVRKDDVEIIQSQWSIKEKIPEKITIYEELPYDFDEYGIYKKDIFVLTENKIRPRSNENFWKKGDETVYIF